MEHWEHIIRLTILVASVLLVVGQLRLYRAVQRTSKHHEALLNDLTSAAAEIVVASQRDFQEAQKVWEAEVTARLEGSIVDLSAHRAKVVGE